MRCTGLIDSDFVIVSWQQTLLSQPDLAGVIVECFNIGCTEQVEQNVNAHSPPASDFHDFSALDIAASLKHETCELPQFH